MTVTLFEVSDKGILPSSLKKKNVGALAVDSIYGVYDRASYFVKWGFEWNLPGQGVSYDTCGKLWTMGCLDHKNHHGFIDVRGKSVDVEGKVYIKHIKGNCKRAGCPKCYETWCGRQAHIIDDRLKAYREKFSSAGKVIHVIISPDVKSVVSMDYVSLRRVAEDISEDCGVSGSLIFHPFRRKCRVCGFYPVPHNVDGCPECHVESHVWYFSPHFHGLVFGWVDEETVVRMNKETGWIFRNLGVRKSVMSTIVYQLSHSGIHNKFHTITWFGNLHMDRFDYEAKANSNSSNSELCPICKEPLRGVKHPDMDVLMDKDKKNEFLPYDGWIYEEFIYVFGNLPDEFLTKPKLEDGSLNYADLLIIKKTVQSRVVLKDGQSLLNSTTLPLEDFKNFLTLDRLRRGS